MTSLNGHSSRIRQSLHESIHMIHREDWMDVAEDASPYLRYDHLLVLEDAMQGAMDFRYAIYYSEDNLPIGIACFQIADLVDQGSAYRAAVQKLGKGIGGRIIKEMKVRCVVSGNVFRCGDHGSHFKPGVSDAHRFLAIEETLRRLDKGCYFRPMASVLIVKDLWQQQYAQAQELERKGFAPLTMEPNMVMEVDPAWKDLDAYQEALNAKARTRLRAVLKRSEALTMRRLDAHGIRGNAGVLQDLFDQVLDRAPFAFGRLNVAVYAPWKEQWGEDLLFQGYFLDDRLVGFATAFVLDDVLDVQYVGLDYAHNETHGVYHRMLLDLLEFAMQRGSRKILFGRTAEQAKSNLGALPVDMRFYVRHRNAIANKLVGPFLRSVRPEAFEQRSPFKKMPA